MKTNLAYAGIIVASIVYIIWSRTWAGPCFEAAVIRQDLRVQTGIEEDISMFSDTTACMEMDDTDRHDFLKGSSYYK